jgi:hypothetical protein
VSESPDSLAAAYRVNLFHDSADMIFDGVLGNIQARCDFLVRKTLRHQANRLLLPEREIGSLYRRSR